MISIFIHTRIQAQFAAWGHKLVSLPVDLVRFHEHPQD